MGNSQYMQLIAPAGNHSYVLTSMLMVEGRWKGQSLHEAHQVRPPVLFVSMSFSYQRLQTSPFVQTSWPLVLCRASYLSTTN